MDSLSRIKIQIAAANVDHSSLRGLHVSYVRICKLLWNDMYMLWYVNVILHLMNWYVYDMIRYVKIWYVFKACSGYVMWLLWYMIWYVHDVNCYIWKYENVMIWYMCNMNDMIWLTCKMTNWHEIQPRYMYGRYDKWYDMKEDASGVVVYDNENEKMLGPHALLCVHASGIPLLLHDSTDAYTRRQRNYHYVYHNATMMVVIPNGCPTSTATQKCLPDQKEV